MPQVIALQQHSVERLRFQTLMNNHLAQSGKSLPAGVSPYVTFGDMTLKVPLKNGQTNYEVSVDDGGTNDHPFELKLDDGVFFYPVGVAFYLMKETYDEKGNIVGCSDYLTSNDPEFFTGVDGNGVAESASLQNIYYGSNYNFKIGGKEVWKNVSGHHALYRPGRTFQSAAETGATADRAQQIGCGQCGQGYWDLWNEVALEGGNSTKFILNLGTCNSLNNLIGGFDADAAAVTENNCLFVTFKGFYYCPDVQAANGFCRVETA